MAGLRTLLARVKRKFFQKPFIKDNRYPSFWFDHFLENEEAFLVQIGSNDGKTGDPLYPLLQKNKNWRALFVEPIPETFEKLKNNYPDTKRFKFENVAINEGVPMTFYSVNPSAKISLPNLPYWFDQLGSFDRQHILKHFDGTLEPFIQEKILEGVDLKTLFSRNKIKTISILHIDTEGYDWNILQQLDLNSYEPKFILFEQNHLSQQDRDDAISFLKRRYVLFNSGIDMFAVQYKIGPNKIKEMEKHLGPRVEYT